MKLFKSMKPKTHKAKPPMKGGNKVSVKNPKTVSSKGKTKPGY